MAKREDDQLFTPDEERQGAEALSVLRDIVNGRTVADLVPTDRQEAWSLARECVRTLAAGPTNSTEVQEALWLQGMASELVGQVARETAARESWAFVGQQAGISRQAAWERWHADEAGATGVTALRTTPHE